MQELVASMLAVRHESSKDTAGKLHRAGIMRFRRGHIAVLNRDGLDGGACDYYAVVKKARGSVLSDVGTID